MLHAQNSIIVLFPTANIDCEKRYIGSLKAQWDIKDEYFASEMLLESKATEKKKVLSALITRRIILPFVRVDNSMNTITP